MKTERELFLYELDGHGYTFENTTWLGGCFEDNFLNMAWEMWQASASREGYKLVKECEIKKTDQEIDQLIDERDTAQEKAEELKDKLQDLYGVDFGEHSNANCPFQNAIDYDDSGYKLVPVDEYSELVRSNRYKHEQNIELSKEVKVLRDRKKYYKSKYKAMIGVADE